MNEHREKLTLESSYGGECEEITVVYFDTNRAGTIGITFGGIPLGTAATRSLALKTVEDYQRTVMKGRIRMRFREFAGDA